MHQRDLDLVEAGLKRAGLRLVSLGTVTTETPEMRFTKALSELVTEAVWAGIDLAKPGSDETGATVAHYDPTTGQMKIQKIDHRRFWKIDIKGDTLVDPRNGMSIPQVFEDEEFVGGPYTKIEEKPAPPFDEPSVEDEAAKEAERKRLRANIDKAMGWSKP